MLMCFRGFGVNLRFIRVLGALGVSGCCVFGLGGDVFSHIQACLLNLNPAGEKALGYIIIVFMYDAHQGCVCLWR